MSSVDYLIGMGDWVSGTTVMDERFIGFIDSVDSDTCRIHVTQSDRERIVGKKVGARTSKVRKLDVHKPAADAELRSLIELALMTKDEGWFKELAARLSGGDENAASSPANGGPVHRFAVHE